MTGLYETMHRRVERRPARAVIDLRGITDLLAGDIGLTASQLERLAQMRAGLVDGLDAGALCHHCAYELGSRRFVRCPGCGRSTRSPGSHGNDGVDVHTRGATELPGRGVEVEPTEPQRGGQPEGAVVAASSGTASPQASVLVTQDALTADNRVRGGDRETSPRASARVRACRACGCTDDRACPDGCSWVDADLCSACVGDTRSSFFSVAANYTGGITPRSGGST